MELIGEKIILREVKESDFDFLYKLDSHPLVYKYEENSAPTKDKIVERYSKRIEKMKVNVDKYLTFIICINNLEKTPIGNIDINLNWELIREWELGYELYPEYWGKGYAYEASKLVMGYVFENLNAHKIVAFCNGNNTKSFKLMERLGMKKEAQERECRFLNNEWNDALMYGILEREWND